MPSASSSSIATVFSRLEKYATLTNHSAVATPGWVGTSGTVNGSVPRTSKLQKELACEVGAPRDQTASCDRRRCPVSSTSSGSLVGACNWNGILAILSTGDSRMSAISAVAIEAGIGVSQRFTFGPARSSSAVTVAKYAFAGLFPHSRANPASDTTTPTTRQATGTTASRSWTVRTDNTTANVSGIERSDQ